MPTDPRDPVASTPSRTDLDQPNPDWPDPDQPDADTLLDDLDRLGDLAVAAEQLARLLGVHGGRDALTGPQLSALEQARDNASAIIASLDRAR